MTLVCTISYIEKQHVEEGTEGTSGDENKRIKYFGLIEGVCLCILVHTMFM